MSPRRVLAKPGLTILVLLSVTSGCILFGSQTRGDPPSDDVRVEAPAPTAKVSEMCRMLTDEVPRNVAGATQRATKPASPFTAAWGDPAIILRCGVPRPDEMNNPLALGGEVSGVAWMMERPGDDVYRCTTTLRKAYVEVTIPGKYGDVTTLMDLANAIHTTVPPGL
ncbi:DUF3515 domain-containing protein [Streptomyces sp.]|uniref:DUF3515 domain-containing protein n=1 Tax=Streptomyces sp. TaxID=1931 RepID=UPI002F401CC3